MFRLWKLNVSDEQSDSQKNETMSAGKEVIEPSLTNICHIKQTQLSLVGHGNPLCLLTRLPYYIFFSLPHNLLYVPSSSKMHSQEEQWLLSEKP